MPYKDSEKANERSRQRRKDNPEQVREARRQWYKTHSTQAKRNSIRWVKANPEKVHERRKRFRKANPGKERETTKKWRKANPELVAAFHARRRARKRGALILSPFTAAMWAMIKRTWKGCCAYCGVRSIKSDRLTWLTQDHITPLSKGGAHTVQNIVPCCRSCNSRKGTGAPLSPVQPVLF